MITPDADTFPTSVVNILADHLQLIDPDLRVFKRPLRQSDDVQCVGVFPVDWTPDENSMELRGGTIGMGLGPSFPTLNGYEISIQSLIQDTEEERGIATHSALATRIRAAVARSEPLLVALGALTSVVPGQTEHFRRAEVRRQRYLTMELSGTWLYMSVTQFAFQTESS